MALPFELVLFLFLLATAMVVQRQRDLFSASMLLGIFSLLSAGLFTLMDAVDVAFTEAAVGAGMSTVLFLATLACVSDEERDVPRVQWVPLVAVTACGMALAIGVLEMPAYGSPEATIHQYLAPYYLEQSPNDIGLPNVVTAVLASYRGFDTFGELTVVFTAAVGVTLMLGLGGNDTELEKVGARKRTTDPILLVQPVRMMPVVRAVTKLMIPIATLFALYVQAHGDFGPGGGFQAGVIFATALILYGMVYGPQLLKRVAPPRVVEVGVAAGVLLYGAVGLQPLFTGRNFLDYSALSPDHPQHGQHLGILLVELGVGITVAAVMLTIYFRFVSRGTQS